MLADGFKELLNIGIALSSVHDLDKLLDMILSEAQKLTTADSGSIYLVEGNKLIFKTSRSDTYFKRWGEKKTREIFKSFEMPITKQSIAGYVALTCQPLNIPDVQSIPQDSEFHYNPTLDKKYDYKTVSMLVIPMLNRAGKIIGVLQLINSLYDDKVVSFTDEHEKITTSFSSQAAVAIQNTKLTEELKSAHFDTIFRLSAAAEYRDKETGNHIKRVSYYSKIIAEKMGLSAEETELIFWASPMHDIGKLGIPDAILQKPGKLTPEERAVMEQHTVIGAMVLKDTTADVLKKSRIVALTHHEKVDGTGYPLKLKGEEIPIEGKIVALADVYDALSSRRCYKEPFSEEKVINILKEGSGSHFDGKILDVFLSNINEVNAIREKYSDKEEDFDKFSDFKNINISELLK
ncbi:MAG: GAF domain-containing protein [Elusimicrobiota bacterium]|nr:GAF domain-containing protein [Elusimicrobiota bacterium]